MGNAMADFLCRDRAKERLPPHEGILALRAQQEQAAELYRYAARMLNAWQGHHSQLLQTAKEKAASAPWLPGHDRPHSYAYVAHRKAWICQGCLCVRLRARRPPDGRRCPGTLKRLGIRAAQAVNLHHEVYVACPAGDPQAPFLFCGKCGAYGAARFINLCKPCPGCRPTLPALVRIQQGQHPRRADIAIARPTRACPQCLGGYGPHWCGYRRFGRSAPPPQLLAILDDATSAAQEEDAMPGQPAHIAEQVSGPPHGPDSDGSNGHALFETVEDEEPKAFFGHGFALT